MQAEERAQLEREGYVVIRDLLNADEVASLRRALEPVLEPHAYGRHAFEGERTQRVYALLAKCEAVGPLIEHPRILEIGEAFLHEDFLLSSVQAIKIHPGEQAQALHCDDDAGAPPRPRPPQGFSTVWALEDFDAANGGTRVVPGSHLFEADRIVNEDDAISVEMEAGSVLVYLGGVMHGGGANKSDRTRLGVSIIYCQPWLRQFENLSLSIPADVAARCSERIQRMLGYSMLGPMGNIDGVDPRNWLRKEAEG